MVSSMPLPVRPKPPSVRLRAGAGGSPPDSRPPLPPGPPPNGLRTGLLAGAGGSLNPPDAAWLPSKYPQEPPTGGLAPVSKVLCWLPLAAEAMVLVVNVDVVLPCTADSGEVPCTPFPFTGTLGSAGSAPFVLFCSSGGWLWFLCRSGAPHGSSG